MTAEQRLELRAAFDRLAAMSDGKYEYFIRGDNFQILLGENALYESLCLKTYLHSRLSVRVRLSIGIGTVASLEDRVSDSDGEAFWYSGRTLESMKHDHQWTRVVTAQSELNAEWDVHAATLDYLENSRTENQSEALYGVLRNKTQQEIGRELNISQPSVHSRVKGAGWPLIEKILHRYERIPALLTTNLPSYAAAL